MGWKANIILVCADDPTYLTTRPEIDHAKSAQVFASLSGRRKGAFDKTSTLIDSIWPERDCYAIGVYEKGAVVSHGRDLEFIYNPPKQILSLFPSPFILLLGLHSTSNFAAFAYYEKGALVRRFASTQMDGLDVEEFGNKLSEEEDFWRKYQYDKKGWRVRREDGSSEQLDEALGESLVFAISKKFLGIQLDEIEEDTGGFYADDPEEEYENPYALHLAVDQFRLAPTSWWKFRWV